MLRGSLRWHSIAVACSARQKPQGTQTGEADGRAARHGSAGHLALCIARYQRSQKLDKVQIGREMVVAEKSGPWLRVFANTDIEEVHDQADAPHDGRRRNRRRSPAGCRRKGIVEETTPNGDQIIMGAAANEEALASDPRGPANAAQSARLLYRRVVGDVSQLAAGGRGCVARRRHSVADREGRQFHVAFGAGDRTLLRERWMKIGLKKVIKNYPRTRWAALAAFDLIDNKLCGDWQGQEQCPEKEADIYLKYADDFPDGPRTAQALYEAVYRHGVLTDMYDKPTSNDKKPARPPDQRMPWRRA